MLKVDLHMHTAEDPVDRLPHSVYSTIDRAAALGYDAIAITLHDRQLSDRRAAAYARERGVALIPGVERTLNGKHVLLLNFPAGADSVRSFDEIARLKARSGGLVIAPHPFFPGPTCLGTLLDRYVSLFDAIEFSYFHTPWANFNRRADEWALAHGKPIVGNSDLHDLRQLGRTFSLVSAGDVSAEAICDAIRSGQVQLQTSPVPFAELALVLGGMAIGARLPRRRPAVASASMELAA